MFQLYSRRQNAILEAHDMCITLRPNLYENSALNSLHSRARIIGDNIYIDFQLKKELMMERGENTSPTNIQLCLSFRIAEFAQTICFINETEKNPAWRDIGELSFKYPEQYHELNSNNVSYKCIETSIRLNHGGKRYGDETSARLLV